MKLGAEQLLSRLSPPADRQRPGAGSAGIQLASIYLVSGDEPLLVNEVVDALRLAAAGSDRAEREAHIVDRSFSWERVAASLASLSLFSAGKLVEIRLGSATPGDEGSRHLRQLAARPADDNVVVIITPALTRKIADSAWAKALTNAGVWVETRPPSLKELPRWIAARFRAAGLGCAPEGLELLAGRIEGNLLAARQEIDKLALLYPAGTSLTAGQIRDAVADGARYDVFQLGDAALAGDAARALRVLAGLRDEGTAAPLVLWSLVRESLLLVDAGIRASRDGSPQRALQGIGVWQSRTDLYLGALARHKPAALRRLLKMTGRTDQIVKGARPGDAWNALLELTLALAGRPLSGGELN